MTYAATAEEPTPVVELLGVHKSFGGVRALRGVDLVVPPATVIGLAGENGAGKSTLLKVLAGIYTPDQGEVRYDGEPQPRLSPAAARTHGVAAVAQELSLFEHLTVAENVMLGQEPRRGPLVDARRRDARAREMLDLVGSSLDVHAVVRELSFADRQMVEIAKALVSDPRVLILDEPTSGLREAEVATLLDLIGRLREQGRSVVFITHRMSEMFAVCDTFVVLKDGTWVATVASGEVTEDELVGLMVGRAIEALYPDKPERAHDAEVVLEVEGLSVPGTAVTDISLRLRAGEILGVAGLAGNGQNELLEAISGLRRARGTLRVGRARGPFRSARAAERAGVWLVPEDRKRHGLVLPFSIAANLTLPTLRSISAGGWLSRRREREVTDRVISAMSIRPPDGSLVAAGLSGGNQQKIVIGKAVLVDPEVYVFADPTRGIDVGTKQEIYVLMRELSSRGKAVLLMSSDLTETIGVCDRVLVLSSGRVVAELGGDQLSEQTVTKAMFTGQAGADR